MATYKNNKKMLFMDETYELGCKNKINYIEEVKTPKSFKSSNDIEKDKDVPKRTLEVYSKNHRVFNEIEE